MILKMRDSMAGTNGGLIETGELVEIADDSETAKRLLSRGMAEVVSGVRAAEMQAAGAIIKKFPFDEGKKK